MNPCQWISVEIMTSKESYGTAKRSRKNQLGGNMVLRSGTSTRLKRATKKRPRISKHSKVKQHLPFLCTCFKNTGKQRKDMIAYANKGQIEAIGEIALNLLRGNILVPNSSFKRLKSH